MLGMDLFRCLTPRLILLELAMHRIAYNLIRALMQRAALTYDVDLERISFKGSMDSLHHSAVAFYSAHRSLVNCPSSLSLCFALSRPIWSSCAPNAASSLFEPSPKSDYLGARPYHRSGAGSRGSASLPRHTPAGDDQVTTLLIHHPH